MNAPLKLFLVLSLPCLLLPRARAASHAAIVCYPGGPVTERQAKPAVESMLNVLETLGNWTKGTFSSHFTAKAKDCQRLLVEKKPAVAIMSLGLFLENREAFHLVPVAQPKVKNRTTENYRILVTKDKYKSLEELKGKTLGGSLLEELSFLQRVVFKGQLDPASYFVLKPSNQALRDLRNLDKGELDAVLVNEQQFLAVASLPFAAKLQAVFTSESIPLIGVVADETKLNAEERARLLKALSAMCTHADGKQMCEMFGLDSFVGADLKDYQSIINLWNAGKAAKTP